MPCMGRHPRSELVEDSPTQDTETAGHQIPGPCALPLTSPSTDWPLCWMIQAQAAVTFCSDLFLPSLLLPLPSSVPSGATLSPQSIQSFSRAVVRQRAGWAVTASWGYRETGATRSPSRGPAVARPHLGVTKLVLGVIQIQRAQQFLCGLPAVHELVIWNGCWVQDTVAAGTEQRDGMQENPSTELTALSLSLYPGHASSPGSCHCSMCWSSS